MRRFAMPVKGWVQRFAFVLLIGAAIGLMILGKADSRLIENLRVTITDITAPVLDVLSRPVASIAELVDQARGLVNMHGDNARLREENARLRHWYAVARALEEENAAFRDLLSFVADPQPSFITARVIGNSGGAFVRTLLLHAGARDGVRKGQAVVSGDGLVGRVVEAGDRSSRILLLTDLNARIPVVIESTRVPGILAGDNTDRPRLTFLPVNARASPGDRIVTSGQGGMLPPGLPIGLVAVAEKNGALVQLFVDWHTLEYVRVLDYTLPGVLPSTRAAGRTGPIR
ncbi:MAG: rod shape-determining protein MreC [Alphaproteobacteria bacterium]